MFLLAILIGLNYRWEIQNILGEWGNGSLIHPHDFGNFCIITLKTNWIELAIAVIYQVVTRCLRNINHMWISRADILRQEERLYFFKAIPFNVLVKFDRFMVLNQC